MGIIGINGKIGSGKDTVAKMIQYLAVDNKFHNISETNWTLKQLIEGDLDMPLRGESGWEIKKFGYKLKEIALLLTGIPIQDFEKQEVKARVLGPEWIRYELWTEPVGDENPSRFVGQYPSREEAQTKIDALGPDDWWQWHIVEAPMTVRDLLQKIGTDCMRNHLHVNTWVNALFADYKCPCNNCRPVECNRMPNWIISDMRFPNEMEAVKERGGMTVRVVRLNNPYPSSDHASETSLDNAEFDLEIVNDGSLEDLYFKVISIEPLITGIK